MSNSENEHVLIFSPVDVENAETVTRRGFGSKLKNIAIEASEVSVETLQRNLQRFLNSVDTIIGSSPEKIANLELEGVEIQAQIDTKGNVGFSAIAGLEVGVQGGIKFILKKKNQFNRQ